MDRPPVVRRDDLLEPTAPDRPYLRIEDVAVSWHRYEGLARSVSRLPAGLVLHVAGPTDEGLRVVEIWRDEAAWHQFSEVFSSARAALDPDLEVRSVVRELRVAHLVGAGFRQLDGRTRG